MKFKELTVVFLCAILLLACKTEKENILKYVDPFICTEGDHGHWHPSALVPFGMVKLGPDTYPGSLTGDGDWAHSGYNFADSMVRGFSHFRTGSSGGGSIYDRGGMLSIMPFVSTPSLEWIKHPVANIDKSTEKASPGYYSVYLNKEKIQVELTATSHMGFHKYKFSPEDETKLFLYSGKSGIDQRVTYNLINENIIEGKVNQRNGAYFTIVFDHPIRAIEVLTENGENTMTCCDTTIKSGFACKFGKLNGSIKVKVGVSLTSIEAARQNLKKTCRDWDFEKTKSKAENLWRERLSAIKVTGKDIRDKRIFYTALYHTCFFANNTI